MIVGAAAYYAEAALHYTGGQGFGVGYDLLAVFAEFRLCGFAEADGFGGDDVHERSALNAGESDAIEILGVLFAAENQAAARAAESFVGGGGNEIGVRDRAGMYAGGDQAGDVGHVHEEQRADGLGDFAHAFEIDDARIGAGAYDDHFGLVFLGEAIEFVVVDRLGVFASRRRRRSCRSCRKNSADDRG